MQQWTDSIIHVIIKPQLPVALRHLLQVLLILGRDGEALRTISWIEVISDLEQEWL